MCQRYRAKRCCERYTPSGRSVQENGIEPDIQVPQLSDPRVADRKPLREADLKKHLINEIKDTVSKIIGPIAKPDKIQIVPGLPKTRSGKIMRRILRKVAEGSTDSMGDTSTLLDPEVVEKIIEGRK